MLLPYRRKWNKCKQKKRKNQKGEIKKIDNRKSLEKINETKKQFFENNSKSNKSLSVAEGLGGLGRLRGGWGRLGEERPKLAISEMKEVSSLLIWWILKGNQFSSVQFSSVTQSCPTVCDPKNCSTPGLPVHHQLLESTQTHVHRVSGAIQPSHPL